MEEKFNEFLKRTNLYDIYHNALIEGRKQHKNGILADIMTKIENPTCVAINDAWESSEEYKQWSMENEKAYREREQSMWDEVFDNVEFGSADYDCVVAYAAGTNWLYRTASYIDTKTYCEMNFQCTGISASVEDEKLTIRANGNAELNCLIDAFLEIASILNKQKDRNECSGSGE